MKLTPEILEQAATWYVDLQCALPDDPIHDQHRQWLALNPLHRKAWQRMERLQQNMGSLPGGLSSASMKKGHYSRRHMIQALAVLLAVGITGYSQRKPIANRMADHYTGIGQQRSLVLDDGSRVEINTDTAFNIDFSSEQRILHLRRGEILVTTASDPRPFSVQTRHGQVLALGTRFQVFATDGQTKVQVHEHAVEIRPVRAPGQALTLYSGQQSSFNALSVTPVSSLPEHADSWVQSMLIVSDWSLGDFIDELKRYHPKPLDYTPAAARLRVSGAFHLQDTHMILDTLSATLPIQVRRLAGYWTRIDVY